MRSGKPKLKRERKDPLALEIQEVLEEDLARGAKLVLPAYRACALESQTLDGYCAAAVNAYFHLGGGVTGGLEPWQLTHADGSHWWIVRDGKTVIDLIFRPHESSDFPYEEGRPRKFMMVGYDRPTKRGTEIIRRVRARRRGRRS